MDFHQFKEKYRKNQEIEHFPNKVSENPLVSVCIQAFQHENFITTCLDSILEQQTDFDFEILLGEDFSIDKTREICISYAEKFPDKIRLFLHHPQNKIKVLRVPTGNFNAFYNFFSARGEFIAFCEGDDYWSDPLKLQKQVDFLRKNDDYALSYHRFQEVNEKQIDPEKRRLLDQATKDLSQETLKKVLYHPLLSTVCFRNSFRELPEEMAKVINVDSFLLSLLGQFGKARFQPEINFSIYRRHERGIWSRKQKEKRFKTKIHTFQKLKEHYKKRGDDELSFYFSSKVKTYYRMLSVFYLKKKELKKSIQSAINSLW